MEERALTCISAELFQLCYLAGRQAPLLVSVTTVSGYKTLKNTP